ncbi:acyltransferase [Aspergillus luchuensis]|uniref:Acyltransferase n=1 Tax=Aspergillus kawachii TaxID=1069201 RepID=A0A146FFV5_ASPKA|nr:acyltransferase [Aspergillus luchuensis]
MHNDTTRLALVFGRQTDTANSTLINFPVGNKGNMRARLRTRRYAMRHGLALV